MNQINNTIKANEVMVYTGFLHNLTNGFPSLFHDFKPNFHDQTEISVYTWKSENI